MTEQIVLPSVAGLGIGGILALVVFYWKRIDDQRYAADLKEMMDRSLASQSEMTKAHAADLREIMDRSVVTQSETTKALRDVAAAIEKLCLLSEVDKRLQAVENALRRRTKGGEA